MKTLITLALTLFISASSFHEAPQNPLVIAARDQIGKTIQYDPKYKPLDYPNGDVPIETGVCADVVVRAFRSGLELDLQRLVHEDMTQNFSSYPSRWGLSQPDFNIDHRRVANLQAYFERMGYALDVSQNERDYQPGDLVTSLVPPNLPHIMVVSDKTNVAGRPLVIHNIGAGTREEDLLFKFKITGHYRVNNIERDATIDTE